MNTAREHAEDLLELMRTRIRLSYDVARWKWTNDSPIDHAVREEELLDKVEAEASIIGMDTRIAREFFRDQIEASKIFQRDKFDTWKRAGQKQFADVPDLRSRQRKELDNLMRPMLVQLQIVLSCGIATPTLFANARLCVSERDDFDMELTQCALATLMREH